MPLKAHIDKRLAIENQIRNIGLTGRVKHSLLWYPLISKARIRLEKERYLRTVLLLRSFLENRCRNLGQSFHIGPRFMIIKDCYILIEVYMLVIYRLLYFIYTDRIMHSNR